MQKVRITLQFTPEILARADREAVKRIWSRKKVLENAAASALFGGLDLTCIEAKETKKTVADARAGK